MITGHRISDALKSVSVDDNGRFKRNPLKMKNIYVSPDELKSLIKFDLLSVECFVKSDSDGIVKVKCLDTGDEFVNYFHDEIGVNLNIFLKDFHLFLQKINKTRGAIIQKEYFQEKLSTLFM